MSSSTAAAFTDAPSWPDGRRWLLVSHAYGALVALGVGYFLLRIPVQVTDSFTNIVALERPLGALLLDGVQQGYLRPALWAELKLVYALSGGDLFEWYRLTHVVQVFALVALFVHLLRPRTAASAVAVPLALGVLVGGHTFVWTVREAFPINTFLTVLIFCGSAANLSFGRYRWWTDVLAVALFAVAALTVESGLLVWVIVVVGYLLGLRGVSKAGLGAVTGLLVAYFAVRFLVLDVGAPDLIQRDAGFGFERYTGQELQERFGASPWGFYAYNVVSSISGVLFAEPRHGVWRLTQRLVEGGSDLPAVVNVISSTLATALVGVFAWRRRVQWAHRRFEHRDRLVILFAGVLVANAVLSYGYTKDVIVSPAGMFLAAAVFAACADLVDRLPAMTRGARAAALVVLIVASCTWAVRAAGVHAALAETASTVRQQWAYFDEQFAPRYDMDEPNAESLKRRLQDDAIQRHPAYPTLRDRWLVLFDIE